MSAAAASASASAASAKGVKRPRDIQCKKDDDNNDDGLAVSPVQPVAKVPRPILRTKQAPLTARQFWNKFDPLALLLWARHYEDEADAFQLTGPDAYSTERLITFLVERQVPYPPDEDAIRINLLQRATPDEKKALGSRVPGLRTGKTWTGNSNPVEMERPECGCNYVMDRDSLDVRLDGKASQQTMARAMYGDKWKQVEEPYCAADPTRARAEIVLDTTDHIQLNCVECQRHMEIREDRIKETGETVWFLKCHKTACSVGRQGWRKWRTLVPASALPDDKRQMVHSHRGCTLILGAGHTLGVMHDKCKRDLQLSLDSSEQCRQFMHALCDVCPYENFGGFYRKNGEFLPK
jgi:hypothetical protein